MLPLPELQRRFGTNLLDAAAPLPPVRANGLSAARRLQVYRHNMLSALVAALETVFPASCRLVGEEFFAAAARVYIAEHPSRSGNIQDYGSDFPAFLQGYDPAASLPYLGDVARLEWARLQASMAEDSQALDLARLATQPPDTLPDLRFVHQAGAYLLESCFPVLSLWEFCQAPDPVGQFSLDVLGERVRVARAGFDVVQRRLTPGEYAFHVSLFRGETFGTACAAALDLEPGFDVQAQFSALVREQILTDSHT